MTTSRPNIVLIMCDQMRWDAAGFAGSPVVQTPHLDQLAASGVCFENAYCASPVCSPARASWLTGLYPHAQMMTYYYALITHIDNQVGRLLNALEGTNTVVAFMSDHGELLGDHGYTEKCLMYEASVRVPCLLSWQNQLPSGFRVTTPLAGVDLMPTVLGLAGHTPENPIDGRSVAEAILDEQEPEHQPIFAEIASLDAIYHNANEPEELAACMMVTDGYWKYIRNRFDIDELYDLKTDPGEMQNIAERPEHKNRIAQMRQQIADMVSHTGPGPYAWCL